ncbi:MAG: amidohydrolase family protein [Planctomycetota bacterium]
MTYPPPARAPRRRCARGLEFLALALIPWVGVPRLAADLPTSKAFVITGAQVVLEPGKVLDNATLVARNGVIEAVGVNIPVPYDALEIKAQGFLVHAGLIDGGSAVGYDVALRRSEAGPTPELDVEDTAYATTPVGNYRLLTPEFQVSQAAKWDDKELEGWRLRGFTDRLVTPEGGLLSGQSALFALNGSPVRESLIRDGVFQQMNLQVESRQYPITLMGKVAHLRQTFSDAEHHQRWLRLYVERGKRGAAPPIDPTLTSLAPLLDGTQRLAIFAQREDEIDRALNLANEWRVQPVIVGGLEAWKLADRLKEKQVPVLVSLQLPAEPKLTDPKEGGDDSKPAIPPRDGIDSDTPLRVRRERHRHWRRDLAGIRKLDETGVLVGFAVQGVKPEDFAKNIETLQRRGGLSRELILKLFTTGPAQILGIGDRLGSIAPGRRAHLVIRKGDPFDKQSWVRYVLIDGRLFEYPPVAEAKRNEKPGDSIGFGSPTAKVEGPHEPRTPAEKRQDELAAAKKAEQGSEEDLDVAEERADPASELEADRRPTRRSGGNILLKQCTVLTVKQPDELPDTDILVENGKITAIGHDLPPKPGMLIVDGRGLHVIPGIIDSHSHMAINGGINEYSLSITPEVKIKDIIDAKDVALYRALAGGVTTARILHGSANTIGGQDAVIKLKYGQPASTLILDDAPLGVKFALGENVTRTRGRFPSTRLGVEAVLIRAFAEAQAYQRIWDEYRKNAKFTPNADPPRRDDRLEALAKVLKGDLKVHCHCYRADEILMLLRVADQFGFKVQSLQHALEGYKVAPEIARHGCGISTFSDWWAYKWEAYDATPYNAALLREAGVATCLKSDSDELVRHMNHEAAKLLRYGGLSPLAALETITLLPARILGLEDRVGSIEVGKDADLAVFAGHPLNTYSRCVMTLVDGEVFFEERKSIHWGDDNSERPTPPTSGPPLVLADGPKPRPLMIPTRANDTYAIMYATVHPVDKPEIERGTVIVRDGKIAEVGTNLRIPTDATVVEAEGWHLYPGLIDAGTKVGLAEVDSARETNDYLEEGPFQPDLRAAAAIHPDSELIPVTRAGGVTTVLTMPISGILSGQSALVNMAGWVPKEMVVTDPVALHVKLPAMPRFPEKAPQAFMGRGRLASERARRLGELRSLFELARHYHAAKREAASRSAPAPVVDPRLEALGPYVLKEKPVVFRADAAKDIREAVHFADQLGVRMILSGGRDAWKVIDLLKEKQISVIVGPVLTLPGADYDPYDSVFRNLLRLHENGIPYCVQSDETSNSRNLPFHAAMAVAYGLPPEEGLKAITLYPARILGVDDLLGSITPGKMANLILTDGDPLQAATNIGGLFIGGRPVDTASKHTRLYERYRERLREVSSGPPRATPPAEPRSPNATTSGANGGRK